MGRRDAEVQLATLVRTPPRGPGWVFELKYDGYRAVAVRRASSVELRSRGGLPFPGLAVIRRRIGTLPCRDVVLDGELCALDDEGRPSFERLVTALGRGDHDGLVYFVFDVLELDGVDLRSEPLEDRKRALARVVRATDHGPVRRTPLYRGDGASFLEAAHALGLEGLVAKRADRPYRAGRSLDWQKVKIVGREELVIVGMTPPSGARRGLGALLLGTHDGGVFRYAGKVGSGLDEATLASLARRLEPTVISTPPVVDPPRLKGARWVRPTLVAEVRFTSWTRDGRLRHPVFLGVRSDKAAGDVVRDRASDRAARIVEATRP